MTFNRICTLFSSEEKSAASQKYFITMHLHELTAIALAAPSGSTNIVLPISSGVMGVSIQIS